MSKKPKTKTDQINTKKQNVNDNEMKDLSKESEAKRALAQKTIIKKFGERK